MEHMNENTRITLTIGQLRKLVLENVSDKNDFEITKDGILIKYHGDSKNVTIPNGVIKIACYAFEDHSHLEAVIIPDGVTSIGNGAFFQCWQLKSITVPSSVTSIDYGAFNGCESLAKVKILNSVLLKEVLKNPDKCFDGTPWGEQIKNGADPDAQKYMAYYRNKRNRYANGIHVSTYAHNEEEAIANLKQKQIGDEYEFVRIEPIFRQDWINLR